MNFITDKIKAKQVANRLRGGKVTDRIKTVEDVLHDNDLTRAQFDSQCIGLEPDEVAYRIIKLLAKSLNEGWIPDWNSNEYKYTPYFDLSGGSSGFRFYVNDYWLSNSGVGSRLCFKTSELAQYAGKQFLDVYKKFMIIE